MSRAESTPTRPACWGAQATIRADCRAQNTRLLAGEREQPSGSFGSVAGARAQPFRLRRKGFAPTPTPIGSGRSPTNPPLTEQKKRHWPWSNPTK
ncbi:MAG TPA: hypothetical protein VG759_14305 [Candidatus Angelobacter sp.]|nr:hypothetical protein [Candidatus Angelobacter sp.]